MSEQVPDMDVTEFARRICMLRAETPLADEYDRRFGQRTGRWWTCQREHLTAWCLLYPAGGCVYAGQPAGFRHKPSDSARRMYYYYGAPETLLWLIEALGGDISALTQEKCTAARVREAFPFDAVLDLLTKENA